MSYPLIGDETIYLFPELDYLSFFELVPGVHKTDLYYGHPPLYPLALRLLRTLFGETFFPLRMFSLLTFFSCLYLVFRLLKESENTLIASWGFFTILLNQVMITHSTMILPDLLFVTLGLASWFFFIKRKPCFFFIFSVLCMFVREEGLAFIFPVLALCFYHRNNEEYRKFIGASLGSIILLGLYFAWTKYSYGSPFNNIALKARIEEGFSFFSINRQKFHTVAGDLFVLKSFSTTIPFLLVVSTFISKISPKKWNFKIRKELTWLAIVLIFIFWLVIISSPDHFAFRLHHTLVNISIFVKILLGLIFVKGLQNLFPEKDIQKRKLKTSHFLFPFAFFLIIAFYFFYNDSSPRNINSLHVLYVMFGGFLVSRIFASRKAQYLILLVAFLYQLLWIKVPQVPLTHTHFNLYDELVKSVENINQKLNDLKKEGKNSFHTTGPFTNLLSREIYGWKRGEGFHFTQSPSDAEVLIKTNYEGFAHGRDQRIDEYLKSNKTEVFKREKGGEVYFEIHLLL